MQINNQEVVNQQKQSILQVQNLTVYYGMVWALENISIQVNSSEIVAMIGPNGAGKSTALKAVSGVLGAYNGRIERGDILFNNESIKGLRTDQLVKKGMSLVPEGRRIFPTMTVNENLEMGAYTLAHEIRSSGVNERIEKVFELFPVLKERKKQRAGTLSTGEQQMLAIGRALMLNPKLLLLDEPSLGLSPNYVEMVFDKLTEINRNGTSILLVEQNAQAALEVCHRGYVFDIGTIALQGEKESLLKDEKIQKIFLGQ
ncbi:MAG: ABC transporter ATP-binding protein [bacterium]